MVSDYILYHFVLTYVSTIFHLSASCSMEMDEQLLTDKSTYEALY